jgi:hypothetical protein
MTRKEYFVDRRKISRPPTHPGVLFAQDVLPALERRTITEIAILLGVSRQTLHRVMAARRRSVPRWRSDWESFAATVLNCG